MRTAMMGALLVAGLVFAVFVVLPDSGAVFAQRPAPGGLVQGADGLLAFSETVDEQYQQVTLIDPERRVMAVYHVELETGKIALQSVRNFHWDLQMMEFNGENPLPQEIQSLLEGQ
jgi:hypothetical protein